MENHLLKEAIKNNDLETVKIQFEINPKTYLGSPLYHACVYGHLELTKFFIEKRVVDSGANPQATDDTKMTSLHVCDKCPEKSLKKIENFISKVHYLPFLG